MPASKKAGLFEVYSKPNLSGRLTKSATNSDKLKKRSRGPNRLHPQGSALSIMDRLSIGNETPIKPELFAPHADSFHSQRIHDSRTCMDTGRKGQKVVAVLSLFSLHFGAFLGIFDRFSFYK